MNRILKLSSVALMLSILAQPAFSMRRGIPPSGMSQAGWVVSSAMAALLPLRPSIWDMVRRVANTGALPTPPGMPPVNLAFLPEHGVGTDFQEVETARRDRVARINEVIASIPNAITALDLSNQGPGFNLFEIIDPPIQLPNLVRLDLSGNSGITPLRLARLIENLPALRELDLSGTGLTEDDDAEMLARALRRNIADSHQNTIAGVTVVTMGDLKVTFTSKT